MAFVGDISKKEAKKLVKKYFGDWEAEAAPEASLPKPQKAQYKQIDFVNMSNAVQSEIIAQSVIDLKMNDADYFPVLVANQILGGSFGSYLNMNLREDKAYTYGARSSAGSSRYGAARFRATVSVRNEVTDSAVVEILKEIKRIRTEPVDAQKLIDTKKKFAGNFVLRLEQPSTLVNYAINKRTRSLPDDFYKTYLQKINSVTAEDIQRVANTYFDIDHLQIIVVGKGAEVIENIEKATFEGKKIPVVYFDEYGNKIDKPTFSKPIPDGVTVQTVFNDYIAAAGGKDNVSAVNNAVMTGSMSAQGMSLNVEMIRTSKGENFMEIAMPGMSIMKSVVGQNGGYQVMQGQRKDMTDEEFKKERLTANLFPELGDASQFKLSGIESTEKGDAYVIEIADGKKYFYSTETALLIKEVEQMEQMGQSFESSVYYDDYKEVDGVKFPFKLTQSVGPQKFEIILNEISLNQDLPADKFK